MFARGNAQGQAGLERQWKKEVVVVADDPPEPGVTQIAVREQIQTVAFDDGVQAVVVSGGGVDALAHAEGGAVAVPVENAAGVAGIAADHERTSDQLMGKRISN